MSTTKESQREPEMAGPENRKRGDSSMGNQHHMPGENIEFATDDKTPVPLLFGLRERMPSVLAAGNGTTTSTGGATQQPGGQVWDEDIDGD